MKELELFNYEGSELRTAQHEGEPWFVAKDLCEALEIKNHREAVSDLEDSEKGVILNDTPGGKQHLLHVNESGLYQVIFKSRKPEARKFVKWITSEVLPSIRKTGSYEAAPKSDSVGETYLVYSKGDYAQLEDSIVAIKSSGERQKVHQAFRKLWGKIGVRIGKETLTKI